MPSTKLKVEQKTSVALTAAIAISIFAVGFAAAAILLNINNLRKSGTSSPATSIDFGSAFDSCLCGNGSVEVGENCDDNNRVAGDGCGVNCTAEASDILINGRQNWKSCDNLSLNLDQSATVRVGSRNHTLLYTASSAADSSDATEVIVIDRTRREPSVKERVFLIDGWRFQILGNKPLILRLGNDRECVLSPCSLNTPKFSVNTEENFGDNVQDIVLTNTPDVTISKYNLKSAINTAEDIAVHQISFMVNNDKEGVGLNAKVFRQLSLYNGSVLLASFDDLENGKIYTAAIPDNSLVIPANNGQVTLTFKGNTSIVDEINVKNGDGFFIQLTTGNSNQPVTGIGKLSTKDAIVDSTATFNYTSKTFNIYSSYPTVTFSSDTPDGEFSPISNTIVAKLNLTAGNGPNVAINKIVFDLQTANLNTSTCGVARQWILKDSLTGRTISTLNRDLLGGSVEFNLTTPLILPGINSTLSASDTSSPLPAAVTKKLTVYTNTTCFTRPNDRLQLFLKDDQPSNLNFSFVVPANPDASAISYNKADIVFRGDLSGGTLVRP